MNKIKITKEQIIITILFILLAAISILYSFSFKYLLILSVIIQIQLIYKYRNHNIICIFNIFLTMYFAMLLPYYIFGQKISAYFYYNFYDAIHEKVLFIYCLFNFIYYIFMISKENQITIDKSRVQLKKYDSRFIFYVNILIIILLLILGTNGDLVLFTSSYGVQNGGINTLNEYVIIPFLCAFIFSGEKKLRNNIILILFAVYFMNNVLRGSRIGVLQVGLMIFLLYYDSKINFKKMLIIIVLGLSVFGFLGSMRNGTFGNKSEILSTNQTEVYNASISFYRVIDSEVLSAKERIESFFYYLARVFVPTESLPNTANLSSYVIRSTGASLGGGFIPMYFYSWFGYIGVVISGILTGAVMLKAYKRYNQYMSILIILMISTYPRWLVYDPITLVKLPIYGVIYYFIFKTLYRLKI